MLTANESLLEQIADYDSVDYIGKDRIASLVAQETNKRFREVTDDDVLEFHKDMVKRVFNDKCNTDIEAGFTSKLNNHVYRTNQNDQINFIGQYLALKDNAAITQVFWTTEDVGPLPLTRDEFFSLFYEAMQHKNDTIQKYWEKKQELDACTGHDQIRNVFWNPPIVEPAPAPIVDPAPIEPTPEPAPTEPTTDTTTDTQPVSQSIEEPQFVTIESVRETTEELKKGLVESFVEETFAKIRRQ